MKRIISIFLSLSLISQLTHCNFCFGENFNHNLINNRNLEEQLINELLEKINKIDIRLANPDLDKKEREQLEYDLQQLNSQLNILVGTESLKNTNHWKKLNDFVHNLMPKIMRFIKGAAIISSIVLVSKIFIDISAR